MITFLAGLGALLAVGSAALFIRNLKLYRPLPKAREGAPVHCSVLIPARNEEHNVADCLRSILSGQIGHFEVLVLDDHSSDGTAALVEQFAAQDSRVRLLSAPPLPAGWCGKQHACHLLSEAAQAPILVFLDADVRLFPKALTRMALFLENSGAALISGVPRQELRTFSEQLLIPLIHFVMLGFLPLDRMRKGHDPACSAGCGQLFVARRDDYRACGGHRAIGQWMHDGTKLPRLFRRAGFSTDLFDATDAAICRMYSTNAQVWQGLGRSAHEAMGAPKVIVPATLLLITGQLLPPILLAIVLAGAQLAPWPLLLALLGTGAVYLPRFLALRRFKQPIRGALLHPVGILGLLTIQWMACLRTLFGRPATWKGRGYKAPPAA